MENKEKKRMNKKLKITLIVLLVIAIIVGIGFGASMLYVKHKLSKIPHATLPPTPEQKGINDPSSFTKVSNDITNILLLGTDSRDPKSDPGRSDSMMILTIDEAHNKLKLTSIMRDSLVNIEGHGQQKLTHAHAYGGAALTLKTINQNFDMNIENYVQVNFFGLEKIIDDIGGIPINITAAEIPIANSYVDEMSAIEKKAPQHITKAGLQTLNGIQAVGYARIRYVGNGDFQRTERQRTVLTEMFKKLSQTSITNIPGIADTIIPYMETSLKPDTMMSFATYILTHKMTNVEQSRIPYDDLNKEAVVDGLDVIEWDKDATIKRLHQFIFEADK